MASEYLRAFRCGSRWHLGLCGNAGARGPTTQGAYSRHFLSALLLQCLEGMCVLGVYEYVLHAVHSVFDLRSCKYVLVFIKLGSDSGASWLGAVLLDLLLSACSQL